jgi:hypothetical protein
MNLGEATTMQSSTFEGYWASLPVCGTVSCTIDAAPSEETIAAHLREKGFQIMALGTQPTQRGDGSMETKVFFYAHVQLNQSQAWFIHYTPYTLLIPYTLYTIHSTHTLYTIQAWFIHYTPYTLLIPYTLYRHGSYTIHHTLYSYPIHYTPYTLLIPYTLYRHGSLASLTSIDRRYTLKPHSNQR